MSSNFRSRVIIVFSGTSEASLQRSPWLLSTLTLVQAGELPLKLLYAPKYIPSENSYTHSENTLIQKILTSIYSDQLSKQVRRKYMLGLLSLITHKENKQHSQPNTPWAHYYSSISNTHLLHHRHHPSNVGQRLPTYASPQRYYHLQSLNGRREGLIPTSNPWPFFRLSLQATYYIS